MGFLRPFCIWVMLALGLNTLPVYAIYVIPYELRLSKGSTDQAEYFSVLVFLADYFENYFGVQDDLSRLMAENKVLAPKTEFLNEYLEIPHG